MADVMDMTLPGSGNVRREQLETVHCLLLPLNKEIAVLPNAAVAEIIPYTEPETVSGAPDWLLGKLGWRDRKIPLIMFEVATSGEVGKIHKGCRIAVLNTLNGNASLPYVGILMQGLPSLQIVRQNNVQFIENTDIQRQSIKANVNLNGTIGVIPDIDDLEARLLRIQV